MTSAVAMAALDGGLAATGVISARRLQRVQLLGQSTSGWLSVLWEIVAYPEGFSPGSGWALNTATGAYSSTETRPRPFLLDGDDWGKWDINLTVNGALRDLSLRIVVPSALGLLDTALAESTARSGFRGFSCDINRNWRALERALQSPARAGRELPAPQNEYDLLQNVGGKWAVDAEIPRAAADDVWGYDGRRWVPRSINASGGLQPAQLLNADSDTVALWQLQDSLIEEIGGFNLERTDAITNTYGDLVPPNIRSLSFDLASSAHYRRAGKISDAALRITDALTIEMIVLPTGPQDSPGGTLVSFVGDTPGTLAHNCLYAIGLNNTGRIRYSITNGSTALDYDALEFAIPVGIPTLLGLTRSSLGGVRFFVNGLKRTEVNVVVRPASGGGTSSYFRIGQSSGRQLRNAFIASVRVKAVESSPAKMLESYNRTLGPFWGKRAPAIEPPPLPHVVPHAVIPGTVALWQFANNLSDSGPNGIALSVESGAESYGAIDGLQSFVFDGATKLIAAASALLNLTGNLTIQLLWYPPAVATTRTFIQTEGTSVLYAGYTLSTAFAFADSTVNSSPWAAVPVAGRLNHLTWTRSFSGNVSTTRFYLNGAAVAGTLTGAVPSSAGTPRTRIGGYSAGTNMLGAIASVRLMNLTRSPAEVAADHAATVGVRYS